MLNVQRAIAVLGLVVSALTVGCGAGGVDEAVGMGNAKIILAAPNENAASMHVTATSLDTGSVVSNRTVEVKAGSTALLDIELEPGEYAIHVDAYADPGHKVMLGSGDAQATLNANMSTEIVLDAESNDGSV